ncbi:MAG: YigZ family protein [Eubacterium sp.]|nr:YigZ family protein [Eubacterium sp.]
MDKKKIIKNGESEVIIKKSRFLGVAAYVETEEEARELVNSIKKEHFSARHVCYAYSIGEENPRLKFSDDGEPGGTAGKPILDVINNSGIYNVVIAVIRYFGGVLLGTGGLVRAYTQAAAEAVQAAGVKTVCLCSIYEIVLDYSDYDKVMYILNQTEGVMAETDYSDKVTVTATIPADCADSLVETIREKTAGKSEISYLRDEVI